MSTRIALPAERRRVLGAGICALILTVGLARFAYTPMLPIMRSGAGMSDLVGGWLATFNYIGYISGALFAATIGDLRQKFLIYRAGLVIAVLSTIGMGLTDNRVLWCLLRLVSGFSSTAGLLLASGLILNWLIRHQLRPELGLHFTGLGLGIAVSGVAVGVAVPWLAWNQLWLWLGGLGVLFFIPAWFWLPPPVPIAISRHAHPHTPPPSRRWMLLMIASYFCAGYGFVIGATFIVAVLERLSVFADRGGWVWVVVGAAAVPSSFMWDRAARAWGAMPALMVAYALQALGLALPALSGSEILNLVSAALFGGTFAGIVSLTLTLIGRHFPENPAKAMARLTVSYGVAQIVAPALAGALAQGTGDYSVSLWISSGVMLAGIGLLIALMRAER